jgi:Domain of Unknown Function (DUF1540)
VAMHMPKIDSCEVSDCSYNKKKQCHALAITVGGPEACAPCDTYMHAARKGGDADSIGGVGACKVDSCSFNSSFECSASGIKVELHQGHADCATFKHR